MPEAAPLRVAAIDFLNPAPLMWDFDHEPHAAALATRYTLHATQPSRCAAELLDGTADLGLIPVAALTPELLVVPGCTIASLDQVRSILLLVKAPLQLEQVRTVAVDSASRSSVAYLRVLFQHFLGITPVLLDRAADPLGMLADADAALIIGDPALLARERKQEIEAVAGPCRWLDLAHEWCTRTGLPWVAAVWAVRPQALEDNALSATQLILDLQSSRDHGLAHTDDLVREWRPKIALPAETIERYLRHNIHYILDDRCLEGLRLFRTLAAGLDVLPPLPDVHFL